VGHPERKSGLKTGREEAQEGGGTFFCSHGKKKPRPAGDVVKALSEAKEQKKMVGAWLARRKSPDGYKC